MKITITERGKVPVTPGGVGLFFEDLNYDLDGGLFAELLENRNFEAKDVWGEWDHYIVDEDGGYAWSPYPAAADVHTEISKDLPLFAENPHYLRLTAKRSGVGIKNKAYDGVYLKQGAEYDLSFYLRSYTYSGTVTVGVYQGRKPIMKRNLTPKADGKWRRYSFRLTAEADAERADFRVILRKAGTVHLDAFSLMPADAVLGVFRRDLVELMQAMKPGFLRFPGGCVVEGNSLANRYLWKESVGQPERRRHNWNRWAVHATCPENNFRTDFSHYGQTLGVGYFEYFLLCEYLGCKPLPVVSVGIACQYMSTEFVPLGDPALEEYIRDALDLIEFARGGKDTVWGKLRCDLGHPAPFALEYLGVGNEQWEDSPVSKKTGEKEPNRFYERFELFEKRIHEAYPDIKIVGTVGPTVGTPSHKSAWEWTRKRLQENPDFVYCSDEHFYVPPTWLYDNVNVYDGYPRGPKVYAGEYAAHVPGSGCALFNAPQANCWEGALAEAAFMTGMERNSDIVVMKSYAPLFGRLGYTEWSPDMIWFNGKSAYASANYYVQQFYSLYTGDFALKTQTDLEKTYASATVRGNVLYLKVVNATDGEVQAETEGDIPFGKLTRIVRLKGEPGDYNTIEEPFKVAPEEVKTEASHSVTLPPRSFSVLIFEK